MCSTVQTINKFNSNKNLLALLPKVTKLSFASVRMQAAERSHNFVVDSCLQTTPTTNEVLRFRSSSRCPPPSLTRQTLRRRDVVQSPFTVVEVDLSVGDDHRYCRKPHGSLCSFILTGTIFYSILSHFARIQSSRSQYFTSTNHLLYGFYIHFLSKACFKNLPSPQTVHGRAVTRRG